MQWNLSRAHPREGPRHGASGRRDRSRDVCLWERPVRSKGEHLTPSCLLWGSATAQGAGLCLPLQMVWRRMWYVPTSSIGAWTWVLLSPLLVNSMGSQSFMGEIFSVHVSWGPAQFCFAHDHSRLPVHALWTSLTYWCSLANTSKALGCSNTLVETFKWLLA